MSFSPCPNCGGDQSDVKDSRAVGDELKAELGVLHATRRRRVCRSCGGRWSTVEIDARDALEIAGTSSIMRLFRQLSPEDRAALERLAESILGRSERPKPAQQPAVNGARH